MAQAMLSKSGDTIYPLGRGLFATVTEWNGEPRIHIRAYVEPLSSETAKRPRTDVTRLVPTRRGICLNEHAFNELVKLVPTIRGEIDDVKRVLAMKQRSREPQGAGGANEQQQQKQEQSQQPAGGDGGGGESWSPQNFWNNHVPDSQSY